MRAPQVRHAAPERKLEPIESRKPGADRRVHTTTETRKQRRVMEPDQSTRVACVVALD